MIAICPLRLSDRAAWERLARGYKDFYETVLPDKDYERTWSRLQQNRDIHGLGALLDGRLIGIAHYFFHFNVWSDDVCYLQDLFTVPEARGQGVGRALIQAVAEWARARGCCRLYWMTHHTNATARRLYDQVAENRGFIRYQIELGAKS